jgi:hypothetical protein
MSGKLGLTEKAGSILNTINAVITDITGFATVAGQKLMAASFPVVIASDQSAINVTASSPVTAAGGGTVTLVNANTEYSIALPATCLYLEFQARTPADVRWAFETGKVAGSVEVYRTLKAGNNYFSPNLSLAGATLYLASGVAGTVVEVLAWS